MALQAGYAQKKPTVATPEGTRKVLVEKAQALEARGRPDMAIQLWQQILLSDPKNTEALAGVARDYKMIGSTDKAAEALDQLRRANPNDPNIAKIAQMTSTRVESDRLRQAGELAKQGKLDDAMRVYRELFGDRPPDGDIALAYYQTLYGTNTGKEQAIQAMRALAQRNPGDTRFVIELGVMLTYEARTRAEGIRILREHPKDANAEAGLRQALIWDATNPSSAGQLRSYLKDHPQDQEIAKHLHVDEAKLAQMNSGIARTPEERAAFAALNAHRIEEAETRFMALLDKEPDNGRVLAGMGFLRMQENNFGGAISYLTQAEQSGFKDRTVETALATSRFWYTMGEATQAVDENQLDLAMEKYKAALEMRPQSPEALTGLAGLLVKQQQNSATTGIYEQLVKIQPGSVDAWRGLFLSYARENQNQKALAITARFPAGVKTALAKDPEYLRTLAILYQALNRNEDARRTLVMALSLPFPDSGSTLKADTRLQYAGILMEAKRYPQAVEMYTQILDEDMNNVSAWEGLIGAHHQTGQDTQAIADVERMPPAVYEAAIGDSGFLNMLGGIYQQANQFEVAQGLLERSIKLQIEAGGQPSTALQLQLAAIYLQRNDTAQAYALYRQVLSAHPDSAEAWKGLIASMLSTNHTAEALQEIAQMPVAVRRQLENDIDFVQDEASAYAASGDTQHAIETMNRVQAHYTALKTDAPANVQIQMAWLLYNTKNDRGLYNALMRLGAHKDLTVPQRETIQTIWASWAVRRAGVAMDNGNVQRAVDILEAANAAFPDNLTVRKAVAGGYVRVGRAKEALALFKVLPMQDATAGDFQSAVGAALAANDRNQAETWLRQAMERYPRDPAILQLAARYEQARGDSQRAADYYRASLAVMPKPSAANRLAHEMVYPEQDDRVRKASTPADLERILDPNYEPFARVAKAPPLPAYGADPYLTAPVVLGQSQAAQQPAQQADWANAPALPPAPVNAAQPTAQQAEPWTAADNQAGPAQAAPSVQKQPASGRSSRQSSLNYQGSMHVPQADQKIAAPASIPAQPGEPDALLAQEMTPANELPAQVAAQPGHSLASDAWKGLIFSLLAGNKTAEAQQQIGQIPADIRRQLEADVEFEQAEAGIYALTGDTARANEYMTRVQNYYLLRHAVPPAAIALQNAWLLYRTGNESGLYTALESLDARRDLTAAQRQQTEAIWGDWSARRALDELDRGNGARAIRILDAALSEYPDNPNVRMAVAGGYIRLGLTGEAMAIFKAAPMQAATADNMQGAVAAAIAANDLPQAEIWLRQALARYPSDPGVLAVAARFEQARGNSLRASDYWRAAIAAMPPGASMQKYDSPTGNTGVHSNRPTPLPGELKRLLAPDSRFPQRVAPLPAPAPLAPSAYSQMAPTRAPAASASAAAPTYPPRTPQIQGSAQPTFIEQSATRPAQLQTAHSGSATGTNDSVDSSSAQGLRISSQPMDPVAARAQALFAEQTDSQLTRGSAASIDALPPPQVRSVAAPGQPSTPSTAVQYTMAQYTPSAQEAASGAYSTPPQQPQQPQQTPPPQTPQQPSGKPKPAAAKPAQNQNELTPVTRKHKKKAAQAATAAQQNAPQPTLESAPVTAPPQQIEVTDLPGAPAPSTTQGLSDEELQQRELPPLRGPWVRVQRDKRDLSPRDEAEMQLHSIESSYSGWLGGSGVLNYRSGNLGYDQLAALEAPFEASLPLGYSGRLTIVAKPVFLDSGQADGSALLTVQEQTTAGTTLVSIPEPIGTLVPSTTGVSNPPAQQNAAGLGGEIQLAFKNFAIAGGYTPTGFLVATETARLYWKPGNGPFTFTFNRDSVRDSQLSYGGLRDPSGDTLGNQGQIWGGVVANQGNVQYAHGDAQSGFYIAGGGQYLGGYQVESNMRVEGSGGAYWRILTSPEYGNLSIGVNFFAMHYSHNEDAFTHGMGGYFSPQAYFLGNAPITWVGHSGTHWHYTILGSLGVQAFQEDKTPLWPLAVDNALEVGTNNAALPAKTSVGPNYDLRGQAAYQISPHWFVGGFLSANNSRNYSGISTGFSVRFLFRAQPSTVAGPTGLFPSDGIRPFTVP
jgi:tetratricopeptide (TPR) repeat protein